MRPQTIVERLDFVAKRISGLKFTPPTQLRPGDDQCYGCFMSCDMYYIEIKVDQSHQSVKDVIISHGNNAEGISCPVLRKVLADQDFETFAKHLSGLHSIYQISTNDKKVKQRAYPALTALEADLATLYDHQRRRTSDCNYLIHKSPIGIMEHRRGGLPMRLTYFVTPFDLVDPGQKGLINLTINNIIEKNIGLSATVEIEGSSQHKLQTKSLISTHLNSSLPAYAPFNSQNSEKLPAQFVLNLSQPFPMLSSSINQIVNEINTEPTTIKEYLTNLTANSKESIVSLIARQELDLNKGPFNRSVDLFKNSDGVGDSCDLRRHVYSIRLQDQYHTYHILENYLERPEGVYVTKIPFTHPTSIPSILKILRQQALFNFVIGSCIRRGNKNTTQNSNHSGQNCNPTNSYDENKSKLQQDSNIFDVIPVNLNNICILFEHPSRESLATLEIDLKSVSEPYCQLHALDKESVCPNEFASKVLQKCWSIPITLKSVLKKCNERRLAILEDENVRRERELQELIANNSAQQALNYKSHHLDDQQNAAMTSLQSRCSSNYDEKINTSRGFNSVSEFMDIKVVTNSTNSLDVSHQASQVTDNNCSDRTNLLKKFSCKPKVKQNIAQGKSQAGNKILSLMLKRQNPTSAANEDVGLKATLTKKPRTKIEPTLSSKFLNTSAPVTKVINLDTASRLATKQGSKQVGNNTNVSVSLIRSPTKSHPNSVPNPTFIPISVNLPSGSKQFENNPLINSDFRHIKTQSNGSNGNTTNNSNNGKPRKSSINAVVDDLVGGVIPDQQANSSLSNNLSGPETDSSSRTSETIKGSPQSSAKSKSRAPGDQFAIKQGSLGSLKLTVTKTKPASTSSSSSSNPASCSSSISNPNATGSVQTEKPNKPDASSILGIGTTPNIRYTIPKISKTQQAPNSNQPNSADNSNSNGLDSNTQGSDDVATPSSSANNSSAASSSSNSNKRTSSTPFQRTGNSNRVNSVSSSTHPSARATFNPMANATNSSRPSSTSISDTHLSNRISSSTNQGQLRQQMGNRIATNLQHGQPVNVQRMINSNLISNQPEPLQQPLPQIFPIGLPQTQQQPQAFQNSADMSILAMNQAALFNQQRPNPNQISTPPQVSGSFMSSTSLDTNLISSSRPMFNSVRSMPLAASQPISSNTMSVDSCDSLQRPQPSSPAISSNPQFYLRQPMFSENQQSATSSTQVTSDQLRVQIALSSKPQIGIVGESSSLNVGNMTNRMPAYSVGSVNTQQGVSSSSDSNSLQGSKDLGSTTISDPSSPTESSQVEAAEPPPLIPIDSLEEPQQAASPDTDQPDDASDRLSIIDTHEIHTDSAAATPRPSSVAESPSHGLQATPVITPTPSINQSGFVASSSSSQVDLIDSEANCPASTSSSEPTQNVTSRPRIEPSTSSGTVSTLSSSIIAESSITNVAFDGQEQSSLSNSTQLTNQPSSSSSNNSSVIPAIGPVDNSVAAAPQSTVASAASPPAPTTSDIA